MTPVDDPMTPQPTVRACPNPDHAHTVYIEPQPLGSDGAYRVIVWSTWSDVELGIPRSVTYHRDADGAENMHRNADGPIVDMDRLVDGRYWRPVRLTIR